MTSFALITGANRGLGFEFEFVKQYAADGWRVFATCRAPEAADALNRHAEAAGAAVSVHALDVRDRDTIDEVAAELDGAALDLLLNCAGVVGPRDQAFGRIDFDAWAEVLDTNTLGPMRVAEAFARHVGRGERKLIVTITSGMGSLADNSSGGSVMYRTSKAAVNMAMRNLALDLGPQGISSVVINPGWVRTDMGGPNATLLPEESVTAVRQVIERLGPDQSGTFLNYDGREYAW